MSDDSEMQLASAKQRFLAAEAELQAASEALRELKAAADSLHDGGVRLSDAADAVSKMGGGIAEGISLLSRATAELTRGADVLQNADPAKLRSDIQEYAAIIRDRAESAGVALEGTRQTILEAVRDGHAKSESLAVQVQALQVAQSTQFDEAKEAAKAQRSDVAALGAKVDRIDGAVGLTKDALSGEIAQRAAESASLRREVRVLVGISILVGLAGVVLAAVAASGR